MHCLFCCSLRNIFLIFEIISGGAGVGKSYLIRVIAKYAEKILRLPGDHPTRPKVILLAPTGKAASLIGKLLFCNS